MGREASKKALIRIISTGGVFNRTEVNWIGLTPSNSSSSSSSCEESRDIVMGIRGCDCDGKGWEGWTTLSCLAWLACLLFPVCCFTISLSLSSHNNRPLLPRSRRISISLLNDSSIHQQLSSRLERVGVGGGGLGWPLSSPLALDPSTHLSPSDLSSTIH